MIQSDQIPKDDFLKRRKFAEIISGNIFDYISENEESIVFGLNGAWGSGKTVLLDYIKEFLEIKLTENNVNHKLISFSPWQFSNNDKIINSFYQELIFQISPKEKNINFFKKIFNIIYSPINSIIKAIYGVDTLESLTKILEKYLEEKDSISGLKERLESIVIEKKFKIFVFLDDIDRLSAIEIIKIFQIINLQLNVKNFYFFLAYDKDLIKNALSKEYGEYAESYLEKIIQIDYSVPYILREKIREYFFTELNKVLEKWKITYVEKSLIDWWEYSTFPLFFENLRQVKIYINNLSMRLSYLKEEINIVDFIVLEAIRTFDFNSFLFFYKIFSRHLGFHWMIREDNFKIDDEIGSIKNINTRSIIERLKSEYPIRNEVDYNYSNRLLDRNSFYKYFSLDLVKSELPIEELKLFLNKDAKRSELLDHIIKNGRFESFILMLSSKNLHEISPCPDFKIIEDLISIRSNDDIFLLNHWINFEEVFDNILSLQKEKKESIEFFINCLIGGSSVEICRLYLLASLKRQLDNGFKNIYREHKDFIKIHEEKIINNLKGKVISFSNYLMQAYFLKSKSNLKFHIIQLVAEYNPKEYIELQNKHFEDASIIIQYAKYLSNKYEDGELHSYRVDLEQILFPNDENRYKYQEILKQALNNTYYSDDHKLISFVLGINNENS